MPVPQEIRDVIELTATRVADRIVERHEARDGDRVKAEVARMNDHARRLRRIELTIAASLGTTAVGLAVKFLLGAI